MSRLNLSSNFTYYLDDPVRGDQFEQAERRQTYGAHTARNWSADWGGLEMTNKVGAQVRHDRLAPVGLRRAEGGTQWWPWFGQFQLRYFGPRPLIEDNSQRSKGTTLAYLRAGYRINATPGCLWTSSTCSTARPATSTTTTSRVCQASRPTAWAASTATRLNRAPRALR